MLADMLAKSPTPPPPTANGTEVERVLAQRFASGKAIGVDGTEFDLYPEGMREPQGRAIERIVTAERAVRTLETGFALGLSGLFIMKASLATCPQDATHYAMDPFERQRWHNAGLRAFEDAGIRDRLEFANDRSEHVIPQLIDTGVQCDLAFIDGDHRFESVMADINLTSRLVKPGGLLLIDDTWMPSVRTAVSYFIANLGLIPVPEYGDAPRDWLKRRFLTRRMRSAATRSNMVALRLPENPKPPIWDSFVPFSVG